MKQKKRGFTLVELVIVIAVIAILAGVMIAVFANVVNKANDSAKLQDEKQAEIQQKLEDIEKKLENQNWLGWEDFENELAQQIAKIEEGQIGQAEVEAAIKTAIEQYAGSDTALTEEQVQAIIERAMSGQLTQAQVETIVRKYTAEIDGGASASQIQKIVNAAMANQLTAPQVSQLMKELVKGDLTNLDTKLSTLVTNVKNLEIKIDDLSGKITSAMSDTVTRLNTRVGITGAKTVVEAVAAAKEIGIDLNTLDMQNVVWDETEDKFVEGTSSVNQWLFVKSGDALSTVYSNYLQGAWSGELTTSTGLAVGENQDVNVTVATEDAKTVDVYTNGGTLTVNAPNATVNHYGTAVMVNVNAVAKASYHLYGKIIGNIVLKSGRVVAEAGSSVSAIIADTADSAAVQIEVTVSAKVGSVAATAAGILTAENTTVSAAATVKVDTAVSSDTVNLFAGGLGTKESPYLIATAEQLASILRGTASEKIYYSLVNDITITKSISENDAWGDPINSGMAPLVFASLNGNGYSIKDESGDIGNLIPYTSNSEITDIKFFVSNSVVNYAQSMTSFENVMVSGNMAVDRNTGAFVTYANGNISFKNCRSEANITGTAGSGGYNAVFVGYAFGTVFNIRTNFTKAIIENIDEYLDFYKQTFGNDPRFSFYVQQAGDWGGERVKDFSEELADSVYASVLHKMKEHGITLGRASHFSELQGELNTCYAAKKNSLVIGSDGMVYKCTVHFDLPENQVGKLHKNGVMDLNENYMKWIMPFSEMDVECSNCYNRAGCYPMKCPYALIQYGRAYCPPMSGGNFKVFLECFDDSLFSHLSPEHILTSILCMIFLLNYRYIFTSHFV